MGFSPLSRRISIAAAALLLLSAPLSAQIEDHLSAYTGDNAEGYLNPLASAMGTTLNGGIWRSADIPLMGFRIAVEFPMMGLYFGDDDKHFTGRTELGFTPETTAQVPTIIGPTGAVIVDGDGGTSFAFPGGFDIGSFALVAPQIRVGAVYGTEAMLRLIAFKIGDSELGDVMLAGFGVRHSISHHLGEEFPVDLAASFFWQDFKLGENSSGGDLSKTTTWSIGAQVSKKYEPVLNPYAGLYYNSYKCDISYTSEASGEPEDVEISFDDGFVQFTIGLELNLWFLNVWGEYNISKNQSFGAGLGLAL